MALMRKKNSGESNKLVHVNFTLPGVMHWFCIHYNQISVAGIQNINWYIFQYHFENVGMRQVYICLCTETYVDILDFKLSPCSV